jgi:hypothetical protein
MAISASYTIICDGCGTDTGGSQRTPDDALDYAERGGWTVSEDPTSETYGSAVCEDCASPVDYSEGSDGV